MDPLSAVSLAAAVAQFIDFGTKVASRLRDFQESTGEVPKSLRTVNDRLPGIISGLNLLQAHPIRGKDEETSVRRVVEGCRAQVQLLQAILDKTLPSKNDSTLRKLRKALSSLNKDRDLQ